MNEYLLYFERVDCTYRVKVQFLGKREKRLIADRSCNLEQLVDLMQMLEQNDGVMTFDNYPGRVSKLELDTARREVILKVALLPS